MADEATRSALAALVHDVGKHVARTARNVRGDAVPAPLLPLLLADLYRIDGRRRASEVFRASRAQLGDAYPSELEAVGRLLDEIDRLEEPASRGDAAALARVVELAREVERSLRSLLVGEGAA